VVGLLIGDFNATLDHAAVRRLLDTGYVDAADAVGNGLTPTWQASLVPPVSIDHVLVEEGIGVRAVRVHDIARSDHRAVVADLVVPG
jgi:endonuclease/exonuclease/phosphatase family metal-dependent hydrolase